MSRCECAEVTFAEVARRMAVEGMGVGEALRRTGCGITCTACLPDLEAFLGPEAGPGRDPVADAVPDHRD